MEQNQYSPEDLQKRRLSEAGITYSLAALFPLALSLILSIIILGVSNGKEEGWYAKTDWYRYLAYLLPQVCLVAASAIFFKRGKVSLKRTYCTCKWYFYLIAVGLQFGLMFSLSTLNSYFADFLGLFGYEVQGVPMPTLSGWNILPAILVIAVLPAILEETVFRGILSRQMTESGWGTVATVLISGALFSLFHHNPEQTIYQFICGVCFALLALRAGSILPGIVAHFLNNATVLVLTAVFSPSGADIAFTDFMPMPAFITLCVFSALSLAGTVVYLVFFCKRKGEGKGVQYAKPFFLACSVGIGLCALQWILILLQGFGVGV
ncbi:MAG: CPBP family intramembrane metalloprotease [Clostridia bacterium]|nr:CPBP family intramembrane metalloprotease [Clostridia bacterium]